MGVRLCVEHRDSGRQTVVAPHLHDVGDQLRLLIQILPRRLAAVVGIVFERHEGKIRKALVSVQIIEESAEPRIATTRIFPDLDVFRDSLKDRASEF